MFSVIVPVYNVEKYLDKCVESILNQTFTHFELILVDDGSPDRCPQMCDEYAKMDTRVKVLHKQNGGLTSARKAGADAATGKYVVVVDSDDWISTELLYTLNNVIENNKCDVICYKYYLAGKEYTKVTHKFAEGIYRDKMLDNIRESFLYDPDISGLNSGSLPYSVCTKAVRRALYCECQQLVPDDVIKGEDLIYTLHLIKRCKSLYILDFYGFYYRVNQASIMHSYNEKDIAKLHRVAELILALDSFKREFYINKVYVYTFVTFWYLIVGFVQQKKSISSFVSFIKKEYHPDFDNYFRNIHLNSTTLKDYLKLYLVRKHCWKLIYVIYSIKKKR